MTVWWRVYDRKSEIAGENAENRQRHLLEATKSDYDTLLNSFDAMLNILLNILQRAEEGEGEERESGIE